MIESLIMSDCQTYKAITGKEPNIILGKETLNNIKTISIQFEEKTDLEGYIANFVGYNCKIGDFPFGYQIV